MPRWPYAQVGQDCAGGGLYRQDSRSRPDPYVDALPNQTRRRVSLRNELPVPSVTSPSLDDMYRVRPLIGSQAFPQIGLQMGRRADSIDSKCMLGSTLFETQRKKSNHMSYKRYSVHENYVFGIFSWNSGLNAWVIQNCTAMYFLISIVDIWVHTPTASRLAGLSHLSGLSSVISFFSGLQT